jgi:hypothetical protein
MWARELQSSPERSCELADRPQTSTHCPHDLLSTSRHSHGRGMVAARAQWSTCSSPQAGRAMRHHRRHTPVGRNRMRARCSLPTPPPASGAALPGVMEGGAAEAAEKAAAEPPSEPRAGRAEACLQTGAREVRIDLASIDRRVWSMVWSASSTSRAARSAKECVALASTVAPSCLQLHLAIISRVELLLWKGQKSG